MTEQIWVALIAFCGTAIGTLGGILAANKLTNYRISQLEKKVDKHNTVIERMFRLEGRMDEVEHDVRDIKAHQGKGA